MRVRLTEQARSARRVGLEEVAALCHRLAFGPPGMVNSSRTTLNLTLYGMLAAVLVLVKGFGKGAATALLPRCRRWMGLVARLKDVAERAGVSIKTVSNVVNGLTTVRPEIRQRVEVALAELGYRPNLLARNLRKGRSRVIALAVPDISAGYFGELAHELVTAASAHHYTVLIDQTDGLRERERFLLAGAASLMIDGLILSPAGLQPEDLDSHLSPNAPLVLIGEHLVHPAVDHVANDNVAAGRLATEHLLSLGRRHICSLGLEPTPRAAAGYLRHLGYVAALQEADLPVDPASSVSVAREDRRGGAVAATQLLASGNRVDALFCYNDAVALGAMHVLQRAGRRIPDDIAVVGLDDIEDGRFSNPTLTTMAPDKAHLARCALELLLARIAGRESERRHVASTFTLLVRESTAGAGYEDRNPGQSHRTTRLLGAAPAE